MSLPLEDVHLHWRLHHSPPSRPERKYSIRVTNQLPGDGFAIEHDSILHQFGHEPHHDPVPHPSDADSNDKEADSENACINPE